VGFGGSSQQLHLDYKHQEGGERGGGGIIRCSMGQFHNNNFMQQKMCVCVLYLADSTNPRVTCGDSQDAKTLTSSKHTLSVV